MTEFYIHSNIINAWDSNKRYTVAHGGRGSGKSMQFAALCIVYAINNPKSRILCVRGTQNKISESSLQVLKDVISMMKLDDYFNITEHTLSAINGSEFLFYGAKNPQSFKSLQRISLCWVDEATELTHNAWKDLIPSIRSDDSRFLISFNPRKDADYVYSEFITAKHPHASIVELQYWDNPYFPEVLRLEMEYDKKKNYQKYLHVWEGQLQGEVEGALWNTEMILHLSDAEAHEMIRDNFSTLEKIVVAIDPSTTDKATSDACGLIVVGKYANLDRYLVIDDMTAIMSVNKWADTALLLFDKYEANTIVAETNQGGDMIKTILRGKRSSIPYKDVRAKKGKMLRAEPIAALYEQGKVFHLKRFTNLEYEQYTYTGTEASPNALDALVYAIMELITKKATSPNGMVLANNLIRI